MKEEGGVVSDDLFCKRCPVEFNKRVLCLRCATQKLNKLNNFHRGRVGQDNETY